MENRRDFFKAVGIFAAGVVGAKITSYTPKKKEEELQVAESVTVRDADGNEYNMVVVPKRKEEPKPIQTPGSSSFDSSASTRLTSSGDFTIRGYAPPETVLSISQNKKLRKLNV
jgi:hypothetical protein